MRTRVERLGAPARLALFAVALALVGSLAALAGAATHHGRGVLADDHAGAGPEMEQMTPSGRSRADGLASVAGGYSFVAARTRLPLGRTTAFRFRILDRQGSPVRDIDVDGGVRVHLIVVRRDLVGYQHLHPRLLPDGSWTAGLALAAPGAYRAFADFEIDGTKTVLGQDIFVPGPLVPAALPPATAVTAAGGYAVRLTHAELHAGEATKLHFDVSRDGRPVRAFDSYVGHRGHLVALRDGDLSYSHVHPEPDAGVGEIVFHTALPTAGRYRLFLQFKVGGTVQTAPFTVDVKR